MRGSTTRLARRSFCRGGVLLLLGFAVSCGTPGTAPSQYDLVVGPSPAAAAGSGGHVLRVEPFTAVGGRDRYEIVYSTKDGRVSVHDLHRWSQRPQRAVQEAVVRGLGQTKEFVVAGDGVPAGVPELTLSGRIVRFEQSFAGATAAGASAAVVEIEAVLTSAVEPSNGGRVVLTATGNQPVVGPDQEGDRLGVVDALRRALEQAVEDLCAQVVVHAKALNLASEAVTSPVEIDVRLQRGSTGTSIGKDITVRLQNLSAEGALNRLDVLRRKPGHQVEKEPDVRWLRFPARMVEAALADALGTALEPEGRLLRPGRGGRADVTVFGHLRRFEVDATRSAARAVIELEVGVGSQTRIVAADTPIDSPEALAEAFEATLGQVMAAARDFVREAVAAAAPRHLLVRPGQQNEVSSSVSGSVRVLRLSARSDLNRPELLNRVGEHVVEVNAAVTWSRYPVEIVTDALVTALRQSKSFSGAVGGPVSLGRFDWEISGVVTAFEFVLREETTIAEVRVELDLHGPTPDGVAGRRRFAAGQVRGSAVATGPTDEERGKAMSDALTDCLANAVKVLGELAALAPGGE